MPTVTGIATSFIDFTRASNATVTDSDGKVKWAPANLLTNSESFDAAAWLKYLAPITTNAQVAPNGTTTADTVTTSDNNSGLYRSLTVLSGASYTLSFWAKRGTMTDAKLYVVDATNSADIVPVTSYYSSINASTWTLVTQTFTVPSNCVDITFYLLRASLSTGTIHFWGAALYRSDLGGMQPNTSAYPMYNPTTPKNLLGYTEDFSNAAWTKTGLAATPVIANTVVAPNGLQTADKIVENTANTGHYVGQSLSAVANTPYVLRVYAKAAERGFIMLQSSFTTNNVYGTVNLSTGATNLIAGTGTLNAVDAGSGWWRVSLTASPSATASATFNLWAAVNATTFTYTGDGTSGIYLWGAQLSDSASLDPYVPVYGAAVTSAAYYGPRRDFDPVTLACKGLLVEEQRTNLVLNSAAFDQTSWVKTSQNSASVPTITADAGASPAGDSLADRAQFSRTGTTSADRSRIDTSSITVDINSDYTFSVWMKSYGGSAQTVSLSPNYGTGTPVAVTVTSTWQRFSITANTSSGTTATVNIGLGYVTNSVTSADVLIWGAQLEKGSFATSYIPVGATTAGATRNADVASVSTQAFPYSASEGTIVVAWQLAQLSGSPAAIHLTDAAESNRIRINAHLAGLNRSTITAAGALVDNIDTSTAATGITKYAIGGKSADYAVYRNGSAGGTSANAGFPSGCTEMRIGRDAATGNFNGHIRQITYLPRRISNTDLVTRTSA